MYNICCRSQDIDWSFEGTGGTDSADPSKSVYGSFPPARRACTVISSDDEESPMHSSSLSKYRGDVFTAGDTTYQYLYLGAETDEVQQALQRCLYFL